MSQPQHGKIDRKQFWEHLVQFLTSQGHAWAKDAAPAEDSKLRFPVEKGTFFRVNVCMGQGSKMRVEIFCDSAHANELFEQLLQDREKIEARFPKQQLNWEYKHEKTKRVSVSRDYDKDQADKNTKLCAWIAANLIEFRAIAKEYSDRG